MTITVEAPNAARLYTPLIDIHILDVASLKELSGALDWQAYP